LGYREKSPLNNVEDWSHALHLDCRYARYLITREMLGIEPTPRERALGLIAE